MKKSFLVLSLSLLLSSNFADAEPIHWIAVGNSSESYLSNDGQTWTKYGFGTMPSVYRLAYGNGIWGGISTPALTGSFYSSTDGKNWVTHALPNTMSYLNDIAYGQGQWVIAGDSGIYSSSDDGNTWKTVNQQAVGYLSVAYNDNQWIAGSSYPWGNAPVKLSVINLSTNGVNWTESHINGMVSSFNGVTYAPGLWMAVGTTQDSSGKAVGVISTSTDSQTWTSQTIPETTTLYSVAYGNGLWVIGGSNGLYSSIDFKNWDHHVVDGTRIFNVRFSNGQWVADGPNSDGTRGLIYTSTDGETWFNSGLQGLPYMTALGSDGQNPTPPKPPANTTVPLVNDTSCMVVYGTGGNTVKRVTPITAYVFTNTATNPQYSGLSLGPNESVPHAPLGVNNTVTPNKPGIMLGDTPNKVTGVTTQGSSPVGGYIYQSSSNPPTNLGLIVSKTDPCAGLKK